MLKSQIFIVFPTVQLCERMAEAQSSFGLPPKNVLSSYSPPLLFGLLDLAILSFVWQLCLRARHKICEDPVVEWWHSLEGYFPVAAQKPNKI